MELFLLRLCVKNAPALQSENEEPEPMARIPDSECRRTK